MGKGYHFWGHLEIPLGFMFFTPGVEFEFIDRKVTCPTSFGVKLNDLTDVPNLCWLLPKRATEFRKWLAGIVKS